MLTIEEPGLVDLEFVEIVAGIGGHWFQPAVTGKTRPWGDDEPTHTDEPEAWEDEDDFDDVSIDWP